MATDGELVERVRAGDREAFGTLVDRYRDMVYGLGYHLTGDFEAARDLAQEAFVQAYLKLADLRDAGKFGGWLRRIAVNLHRMELRRGRVTTVPLAREADAAAQDHRPSEIEAVVGEALGKLRAAERLALTLHYIDGYSHAEIGDFLGVKPAAVKARLARARQRLRREVMTMVEDTFESKKLPDEFTERTVAEALGRGNAALNDWDHEAALDAFARAVALRPGSAEAHAGLGVAWALRGESAPDPETLAKAKAECEKALELDPHCEEAWVQLAIMTPGNKREVCERAVAACPDSAELRYQLAWAIHEEGDTKQAVAMMTAALEEDLPAEVRAKIHNNLGSFYEGELRDPTKGREHFRLAAEASESPDMPWRWAFFHWRVYAWAALRGRQWQEAERAARHALQRPPTDFERRNLRVLLASSAANLGDTAGAIRHLKEASTPAPEPPSAERWPFQPPPNWDPLDWARQNAAEYFAPIANDIRFREILGESAADRG